MEKKDKESYESSKVALDPLASLPLRMMQCVISAISAISALSSLQLEQPQRGPLSPTA